jgi:hypothetical protein
MAALVALALLTLGSATASATTALRTDPGGILLSGGSTIRNTASDPAVFASAAGTVICTQTSFDADANSNTSATSISGTLTGLTFTSCTDNIIAINYSSCSLQAGTVPTVTITSSATGGSVSFTDPVIRCAVSATTGCYFTALAAVGNHVNASSSIAFTNVGFGNVLPAGVTDAAAAGTCFPSATVSVTLTHIVQGATGRTVTITTL